MKLLATDSNVGALFRMLGATWRGTLGQKQLEGVHFQQGDEIRIEGERSNVILDGEIFQAKNGMRSEEHTSELQSLMRTSYAVFCLKKKNKTNTRLLAIHLNYSTSARAKISYKKA